MESIEIATILSVSFFPVTLQSARQNHYFLIPSISNAEDQKSNVCNSFELVIIDSDQSELIKQTQFYQCAQIKSIVKQVENDNWLVN